MKNELKQKLQDLKDLIEGNNSRWMGWGYHAIKKNKVQQDDINVAILECLSEIVKSIEK